MKELTSLSLSGSEIDSLLDPQLLETHIKNKVITKRTHPKLPLAILNYSNKTTFEGIWDSVTMRCRGLIYSTDTGRVVSVPFAKFFNYDTKDREETWPDNLPTTEPEITTKLDGSLGVMWRYKGRWGVATRGSFDSPQAVWATDWLNLYSNIEAFPKGWTPLFEIIYPENQIVVKYPFSGCILIGMIDNETGQEMSHFELSKIAEAANVKVVEKSNTSISDLSFLDTENEEGYVATWHKEDGPPLKVKIKFATYFRLHRLLTGTSPKRIWEILKEGSSLSELVKDTPSHFKQWAESVADNLQLIYKSIEEDAKTRFNVIGQYIDTRKNFAEWATNESNISLAPILFKMLDGQSYNEIIWKMIKPVRSETFRKADE